MTETKRRLDRWQQRFETLLVGVLDAHPGTPQQLQQAIAYATLAGGKRLRPLLVYAACEALALEPEPMDSVACAIEMIHTYSLIHDDLPAMDNDDLRRGQPTCHKAYGEALAILAGDALQALAFEILSEDDVLGQHPQSQAAIIRLIAHACGASGMAGGQAIDLAAVGETITLDQLKHMHSLKTGALIRASAMAPALVGPASPQLSAKLATYGEHIGLAFQIHDDILDVTGKPEQTGKSTQKDARDDKPTFPALLGLEASGRQASKLRDLALAQLHGFPGNCDALEQLACFAVDRDS